MASVSESIAAVGLVGLGVGIVIFAYAAPQEAGWTNATFPVQVESKPWSPLELVALGTLFVSFLTTASGIFFKFREDRRATRELDARLRKLEREQERSAADDGSSGS